MSCGRASQWNGHALLIAERLGMYFYPDMSLSKYILRGKVTAVNPLTAETGNSVELLIWLDSESEKMPSEALAKVRRQYEMEARKKRQDISWLPPALALPAPEVKNNQLLFTFPGIKVFELGEAE